MMRRLSRLVALIAAAAMLLSVLGVGVLWAAARWIAIPPDEDGLITIMLIGSDSGPTRPGSPLDGNADGFHVVVVSEDRQHATIVSFPRDSWVSIPGVGNAKINASLYGGPDRAVAAAESVGGFDVDYWFLTDFAGFIGAVDSVGGVTIDVERRLNDSRGAHSDLQPGVQTLDGKQALSYVRDRKSRPKGDLDRAESHARILQAAHAQFVAEAPTVERVSELMRIFQQHVVTNVDDDTLLRLGFLALTIPPENVQRVRLDGRIGTAGSVSVVFLTDAALAAIADVRADGILGN